MHNFKKLRITSIFFICLLMGLIGIVYLYYLQIHQHTFFIHLAQQQYNVTITAYPPRAFIVDRNNQPLALNKDSIAAFILPKKTPPSKELITFLHLHFLDAYKRLKHIKKQHFFYIKRRLSEEEINFIEMRTIKDINLITEPSRFYPIESAGIITGINDIDNKGLFGIEAFYNKQLMGKPSITILEKDARSGRYYFSKETESTGLPGTPIQLTIDGTIQFLVQEELNDTMERFTSLEGGALVLDPTTGDILALAAYPTFNPNNCEHLEIKNTKCTPVSECYEFGSVMKTFCALAALEEHVVTPEEEIDCMGLKTVVIDGRRINTASHSELGKASFKEIMKKSNNIGIAKVAKRLGPSLYNHYDKLGFGHKIGIPLNGEQEGFIMPPAQWSKQSIISLSYGYEIRTTLLQLARAFSVFLNDGHLITPRLVMNAPIITSDKLYSSESINAMRIILEETMTDGTGRHANIKGYTCLGKTGTANLLDNGLYNP